ncbi:uncharacterized protein LOC110006920 [Amborella trichopoda]|uniref:uncharacterized protein LOC110006920 n=1 Tax=Amborella trichopoda TaxID=13333 RepID=UPI0009BDC9D9|nr:uncharacterized protein LOC110006920 [Amborella trichopoda]|eukprot:XP_020520664.1 uncharacterized protein LOC110006920 [Amborella trichopoda]
MAIMTSIVGLHFGLVLVRFVDHKERIRHWMTASILLFFLALLLTFLGVPLNKSLYTTSYMLLTSATAGLLYCAIYLLVMILQDFSTTQATVYIEKPILLEPQAPS